jgi:hypothetical protein
MTVTEFFSYLLESDASRQLAVELDAIYSMRMRRQVVASNTPLSVPVNGRSLMVTTTERG